MATSAPAREPAPVESDRNDSVEALIEEARRHARRRRLVQGTAAVTAIATAAAIAGVAMAPNGAEPPRGQGAAVEAPAGASPFGVFEPVRGWIVYPVGDTLEAVDPADPSSRHTLVDRSDVPGADLPHDVILVPAGWSADGTKLALSSEHSGDSYVMDASGAITRVGGGDGCCWFVTDAWLSPDGTTVLERPEPNRLHLRNLGDVNASRVLELEPAARDSKAGGVTVTAWSPDGTQIAYAVDRLEGRKLLPSVHVIDLDSGDTRIVARPGFGHIRQLAWSPDGSQVLVIAGPWRATTRVEELNPLVGPKEASLYLVDADSSAPARVSSPTEIASGHYVAAAWSPEGARIAAIDFSSGGRRVVSMNADGSASRVLVELPLGELFTGLAWHPEPAGQ
jgi:hypothetical protein